MGIFSVVWFWVWVFFTVWLCFVLHQLCTSGLFLSFLEWWHHSSICNVYSPPSFNMAVLTLTERYWSTMLPEMLIRLILSLESKILEDILQCSYRKTEFALSDLLRIFMYPVGLSDNTLFWIKKPPNLIIPCVYHCVYCI